MDTREAATLGPSLSTVLHSHLFPGSSPGPPQVGPSETWPWGQRNPGTAFGVRLHPAGLGHLQTFSRYFKHFELEKKQTNTKTAENVTVC